MDGGLGVTSRPLHVAPQPLPGVDVERDDERVDRATFLCRAERIEVRREPVRCRRAAGPATFDERVDVRVSFVLDVPDDQVTDLLVVADVARTMPVTSPRRRPANSTATSRVAISLTSSSSRRFEPKMRSTVCTVTPASAATASSRTSGRKWRRIAAAAASRMRARVAAADSARARGCTAWTFSY